jgi:sulfur carrier protein
MSADCTESTESTGAPTITVHVNGTPEHLGAGTLQDWMQARGLPANALATAVNGHFVARAARAHCVLADGDHILTFQAIQGG